MDRERHGSLIRLVPAIDVRPMFFDRQPAGSAAGEPRNVPGEGKFEGIHDTALPGSVRTANGEIRTAKIERNIPDPAELVDRERFRTNHIGSSPNSAARSVASDGESYTVPSRAFAISAKPSFLPSSAMNLPMMEC